MTLEKQVTGLEQEIVKKIERMKKEGDSWPVYKYNQAIDDIIPVLTEALTKVLEGVIDNDLSLSIEGVLFDFDSRILNEQQARDMILGYIKDNLKKIKGEI